jgi:hypothetical protein
VRHHHSRGTPPAACRRSATCDWRPAQLPASDESSLTDFCLQAARAAGIRGIETRLPRCVLWVDPGQVRYRMDRGACYTMSVEI